MNITNVGQSIGFSGVRTNLKKQVSVSQESNDFNKTPEEGRVHYGLPSKKVAMALAAVAGLGVGASQVKNVVQPVYDVTLPESSYVVNAETKGAPFRIGDYIYCTDEFPIAGYKEKKQTEDTTKENGEQSQDKQSVEDFAEADIAKDQESSPQVMPIDLREGENQDDSLRAITPQQRLENEYGIKIDGKIDDKHNLGWHGDCYLLATLESLNATENGRKLIKENMTINENSVSVHFPGINYTSEISFSDLKEAKEHGRYSVGDDDILIFEVAVADAFTKIKNGEIEAPEVIVNSINDSKDVLYSGYMQDMMFLYTGRLSWESLNPSLSIHDANFNDRYDHDLDAAFDYKMNNHDNVAMTLSMRSVYTPDAYHAYGVISVDENNVTIMNPIGSKIMTISRNDERIIDLEYCPIIDPQNNI